MNLKQVNKYFKNLVIIISRYLIEKASLMSTFYIFNNVKEFWKQEFWNCHTPMCPEQI